MRAPLADITILALEQYAAGPYGSLHLAEMGADVIKIEQPPHGDVGRAVPPYRTDADSLFFQSLNRSKRSLCLDISQPRGRKIFDELVSLSDAVYSNLRGDVPAKLSITYADLRTLNPRIVCCSLSGYGNSGPRAALPGFDYMVQGLSGWMSITGDPSGPPTKSGVSVVDFATGFVAGMSLLAGVHAARRDGFGGDCDVSLYETSVSMLNYLATWTLTRDYHPRAVARSGHPSLVPFGNFPTADGWIVAGGSKEKFWSRLALALSRKDLLSDPRFESFETRLEHREALTEELDRTFLTRSSADWLRLLEQASVPCAPVNTIEDALADPQIVHRDFIFHQDHPTLGRVGQVGSPANFGQQPHLRKLAPALGQDTRDILENALGYDETTIEKLARSGIVAGPGLPPRVD